MQSYNPLQTKSFKLYYGTYPCYMPDFLHDVYPETHHISKNNLDELAIFISTANLKITFLNILWQIFSIAVAKHSCHYVCSMLHTWIAPS